MGIDVVNSSVYLRLVRLKAQWEGGRPCLSLYGRNLQVSRRIPAIVTRSIARKPDMGYWLNPKHLFRKCA